MKAPPLNFGTGTIDGDEEGGALGKENGNVVVEDEEDGEDELGTWNFELCARLSCVPSVASATLWDVERPLSPLGSAAYMSEASLKKGVGRLKELETWNFELGTWKLGT